MHRVSVSKRILAALFLGMLISVQITWANQPGLETSTVLLAIKSGDELIEEEPLFEILDFDKYVLVPLNGLSAYLPYNISFDREGNTVTVKDQIAKRQAIIDLKNRKYLVEDQFYLAQGEQPPVTLNGEFYVSPSLIEYLADVKIEWSYKYQELTIRADWMEKKQEPGTSGDGDEESDSEINYIEGSPYSIGSVRYKLGWEYREDEYGEKSSEGSLELRGDGRAGDWSISLGGEVEYETDEETEVTPSLIRAKYDENNKLIILGDADVYLENTLEQQRVRGFLYMTPDNTFSRYLVPLTVISGPAEPGDKVTLLVNGKEKGGMVVGPKSKEYRFENVPLVIKRLNTIKVIVEKPSGEKLATIGKIAASLRILQDDTHSVLATSGKYKKYEDDDEWVGEMTGFKTRQTLFNNTISFDCEAIRTKIDDDSENQDNIGIDTGIAFRMGKHMVCALDWLVGGDESAPKNGWESSLLYCLERGFIEGIIFYVDPEISDEGQVDIDSGKGFEMLGEIEISDRTSYEIEAKVIDALPGADDYDFDSARDIDVRLVRKFGQNLDNELKVGLRNIYEDETLDEGGFSKENLNRIYSEQYIFKKNYSINNYMAYDDVNFKYQGEAGKQNIITTETDYVHKLTDSLLLRVSNDYIRVNGAESPETESLGTDWYLESELEWISPKLWLGANYEIYYYSEDDSDLEPSSKKYELWDKCFFSERFSLYTNLARILADEDYYTSAGLKLDYYIKKTKDKYYVSLEYNSPYQTRQEPQFSYKIGLIRNLRNGLELKLETERLYETITTEEPETVARLSLGQAIGFGDGRRKTVKTDSDNLSFINGLVYLDENGNHQYDEGERLLPDIKMSLNGRVAVSDENGEYIYNYVQPGTYQLNFALKSLAADYTPATEVKLLRIRETENMFFDFGLTMNGSISGKVYLDVNSNGIYDQGDQSLNWVELALDDGKKKMFAGNDGTFYFENIPLGQHTLTVMEESIPKDMMLMGEKSFAFTLKEKALDVSDLQLRVVYKFKE